MRIEARQISKAFRTGWIVRQRRPVIDGIDLTLSSRGRSGIVGRSGVGKTTLGLILAGILRPDHGQLRCGEKDLWRVQRRVRRELGRRLQMVFQHPESTFDPRWTLMRSLAEPFHLTGRVPSKADLMEMLDAVELDRSLLVRRPRELSGGELQRMAIARALSMQPTLLVLDEPTAMLDTLTQARIIRLLENIHKERGISMVLISHDPMLVRRFCDVIYQLKAGRLDAVHDQY